MELTRRREINYRREWRMIVSGGDITSSRYSYWNTGINPPPYHPDKYFAIRNTYSRRSRGTAVKENINSCYETETITTFLDNLWKEIRPNPDSDIFFDWTDYMSKEEHAKNKRSSSWKGQEDIIKLLWVTLEKYFPGIDRDENKHLILRMVMTLGE